MNADVRRRRPTRRARRVRETQLEGRSWWEAAHMFGSFATGIAAVAALLFTQQSVQATREQLEIAQRGQVSERLGLAVEQLGADTPAVRLLGIRALEQLMHDSPQHQPTVIEVLCALVRAHVPETDKSATDDPLKPRVRLAADTRAALSVLGLRDPDYDQNIRIDLTEIDLAYTDLAEVRLSGALLRYAELSHARLYRADLHGADLQDAHLSDVDLSYANLRSTDLRGADLPKANLYAADLYHADLRGADLTRAFLRRAKLAGAFLRGADLNRSNLRSVDLTQAFLHGADLHGADLNGADLRGADLNGADLSGADLTRARLDDANLTGADLTCVHVDNTTLPAGVRLPPSPPQGCSQ